MRILCFCITLLMLIACESGNQTTSQQLDQAVVDSLAYDSLVSPGVEVSIKTKNLESPRPSIPDTSELERTLIEQGLINIRTVDSSVQQDMKYSTEDNFLHADVYGDFDACYLQIPVAEMLAKASNLLQKAHPNLRILVHDCVRPRSVQYQMWEIVKGTDQQRYVAAPGGTGSMHNYGAAVDLTLVHVDSGIVDMGTAFDFFGKLAQPRYETQYLNSGELTQAQVDNRRLLRWIMIQAGFSGILSEWWHFNAFPKKEVKARFQIVD
ncbi:MAG: M15 family metallopeptidase [Bacteroidota bacterium]